MTPIRVARKSSTETCKRSIEKRSQAAKELVKIIAGEDGFNVQTSAIVKSLDIVEREKILKGLVEVKIPSNHIAAMKATLNIPWYQLREISRWLSTFNIKMSSENKTRQLCQKWVGDGLQVELAPPTKKTSTGRVEIIERLQVELAPLTKKTSTGRVENH